MTQIVSPIMGGVIRCIGIGDEVTRDGKKTKSEREYIMIKMADAKSPIFIHRETFQIIVNLAYDDEIRKKYPHWFKEEHETERSTHSSV